MEIIRKICFIVTIFSFSCSPIRKDISIALEYKQTKKNDKHCLFGKKEIEVKIKNNSKNSIYIPNIKREYIEFFDYIPILENHGSFKKYRNSQINDLKNYLKKNSINSKSSNNKFQITFPVFKNRFQKTEQGDTIDLFYEIGKMEGIYRAETFYCNKDEHKVPSPSSSTNLGSGLSDTLWLEPGEMKTIYYNVTPFLMRKGTYQFQFRYNINQRTEKAKQVRGFHEYNKPFYSEKLELKSGV